MSKRNNKRTRSQRKAARFIETLRRNGGVENVAEVDPRVTKYVLLQEGRDGAVGPVRRIMAVRPGTLGACGHTQADLSAPRPTSRTRGTAGSTTTPR